MENNSSRGMVLSIVQRDFVCFVSSDAPQLWEEGQAGGLRKRQVNDVLKVKNL